MPSRRSAEPENPLLTRAQAGDARALTELLEQQRTPVVRFALRVCVSPEDAQDAAQETLLSLSRYLGALRGAARLSTWLFTVTRNHCLRLARRALRHAAQLETAEGIAADALTVEDLLANEQLRLRVSALLSGLEPAHREVLLRRDVLGESAPEVARALALSIPAVKSRLHRARAQLRNSLLASLRTPH